MYKTRSKLRMISYLEMFEISMQLSERLSHIQGILPLEQRDIVPASFLCNALNVPIGKGSTFSIYSDKLPKVCLYKKILTWGHYNNIDTISYEDIEVDEDGYYQEVVFEWEK